MPNFLEFLRQQNIFGVPPLNPTAQPMGGNMGGPMGNVPMDTSGIPPQGGMIPQEYDAGSRMRELYKPQTDASDRFDQMIAQYPQEQNPSWLRRIAAMLVDYEHGPEAGRRTFEEPRTNAIEDWKNKIAPAQQSANLERYENVNQRTLAYNQISAELREKAQEAKERNDITNTEIRQQRADIYDFKARNPNLKFIMPKGGNVQAMDPTTGEAHDTGIPTGSLTELDKMNIGQEQALERIETTGEQARETEDVRQTGRIKAIDARGIQARQTRSIPTGGKDKVELPTQTRIRQYNNAREVMNSRPDLAPFIKFTGTNDFKITQPNPNSFFNSGRGPSPKQAEELQRLIYGGATATSGRSAGPGPGPASIPFNTSGTIRVRKNGQTGTFKGTAAEAIASGYEVVR